MRHESLLRIAIGSLSFSFALIPVLSTAAYAIEPASRVMVNVAADSGGQASKSADDALYSDGTRAINDGRWSDAEAIFSKIADRHEGRADASLYWKAYAQNKEGKSARALETCADLRKSFPHSDWINECGALEIEIRGRSGDPIQPQAEQDEDLKLLALNSLMQQDESRALPILQQILSSDKSDKLRDRALFVLAQNQSPQARALLEQVARGQKDPQLQAKAIQMIAVSGGKQSIAMLSDVYKQSSDPAVKKAILQAYLIANSPDQLVTAAVQETDPQLAHSAIQNLGAMGAVSQLLDLYRKTSDEKKKAAIINGLIAAGQKGADALGTIATSEQNPELRRSAVRNLGIAGGMAAAPAIMSTYRNNSDVETRKAAIQALFLAGDSHDLIELARAEKDPVMKRELVQQLSIMPNKEATAYMLEILNK